MTTAKAISDLGTTLAIVGCGTVLGLFFLIKELRRIATALEKRNSHADREDVRVRFPGAPR